MKIITNTKLINRNAKIAKYTMWVSLLIVGGSLYANFTNQTNTAIMTWSMVAMIVALLVMQVSSSLQIRFGRSPRYDEQLSSALKGLDDKYTLFHYTTPTNHLLIGPAGIWGLLPYTINGTVVYEKNKWKQKGGSFMMKIFGMESLGRPDLEADALIKDIQKVLTKQFEAESLPPINVALVFANPQVKVNAEDAPLPALTLEKLKDYIRKVKKTDALSPEDCEKYSQYFESKLN